MKTYLRLLILMMTLSMMVACCPKKGDQGDRGPQGDTGPSITGPQGPPGTPGVGTTGPQGPAGSNGHSVAFKITAADVSLCSNGGNVISAGLDLNDDLTLQTSEIQQVAIICDGTNGTNGTNGSNGTNGTNGSNGTNGNNGSNGTNGHDGSDAPPTAFTPVGLINPCGDAPGVYDEVFLKLANGMVIASFSDSANGKNTRFSVLVPGTYVTTDGDSCVFSVDASGNIYNENHHD